MNAFSVVTVIWGLVALTFVILMVYRANLGNHETEQLFLNEEDAPSSLHQENDEVVRRLDALVPICKSFGAAAIVLTLVVAGMWLFNTVSA
jgi:hypothetical protein